MAEVQRRLTEAENYKKYHDHFLSSFRLHNDLLAYAYRQDKFIASVIKQQTFELILIKQITKRQPKVMAVSLIKVHLSKTPNHIFEDI